MKHLIIVMCLFLCASAQAINLVIRPVEVVGEETKKSPDIKLSLPIKKEEVVLERQDWKCKAMSIDKEWGTFHCNNSDGLEVSTRYSCDKAKSIEQRQGFRIFKKGGINLTLAIWCE